MIHFVGAGPGAVDLISVRGAEYLRKADVVIYAGSLVNPGLLDYCNGAEVYNSAYMTLEEVIAVMKKADEDKKDLVRLHTGEPSIYGAVKEQMDELEKLNIEEIQPSRRKYPYVAFKPEREIGNEVLEVHNITKVIDGVKVLDDISFRLENDDKVVFMGDDAAATALFNILSERDTDFEGSFKWGVTTSQDYMPKNHNEYFD